MEVKSTSISTRLYLGFGILLAFVLGVSLVSYTSTNNLIDSTDLVIHTQEVIADINDVLTVLIDAETGQRGFIITGQNRYLEPYNSAFIKIDNNIEDLRELTSDNPVQQKNIDQLELLVDEKFDELRETIDIRDDKTLDDDASFHLAREIVESDRGKVIMDNIRALLDEMTDEELDLLEERSAAPEEQRKSTNLITLLIALFALIFGVVVAIYISKSISKPLGQLTLELEEITKGNLEIQLKQSKIKKFKD